VRRIHGTAIDRSLDRAVPESLGAAIDDEVLRDSRLAAWISRRPRRRIHLPCARTLAGEQSRRGRGNFQPGRSRVRGGHDAARAAGTKLALETSAGVATRSTLSGDRKFFHGAVRYGRATEHSDRFSCSAAYRDPRLSRHGRFGWAV